MSSRRIEPPSRHTSNPDDSERVQNDGSERPPSVRQTEILDDGTLVFTDFSPRGEVVGQTYYWSSDAELLNLILARTLNKAAE